MDLTSIEQMARAAKERADKAYPLPWTDTVTNEGILVVLTGCDQDIWFGDLEGTDGLDHESASFVARSRQDVPALADAVLSLTERVRELEGQRLLPARHSPPYQFILAEAAIRGWSDQELAHSLLIYPLGTGKDWVVEWLQNKRIDDDFASILAATFGASPDLWLNLQRNYDTWLAAKKKGSERQG